MFSLSSIVAAVVAVALGSHYAGFVSIPTYRSSINQHYNAVDDAERFACKPFLPPLFSETPPPASHPAIAAASKALSKHFTDRFAEGDIDSLSVAVITSKGAVYEENFGVTRGNESESSPRTTSHSSYRIASVAKIFTAYEGLILEQKSRLSWDDRVHKYLPKFKPRLDGFGPMSDAHSRDEAPITLFQLATHMSGLGRDWPPGTVSNWPHDLHGAGPPPTNGLPFPTHEHLFEAIEKYRSTSPPFTYPAYSNTGTALLGMSLVAANRAAGGAKEPKTYAELLKRDVFDPLGMNESHFLATAENKHLIVVPSLAPEVADQDFLDAMNPAAGQFSSLSDFIKFTQVILNPRDPKSLITPYSAAKWMQPVHSFEEDDWTEIGFMWEIVKQADSNGRLRKIYWKLGAMAGYHSALAIHPGTGYGVSILMGGHYPDAAKLAWDAFEIFQPAIDSALAEMSRAYYAGSWSSEDGKSASRIVEEKGTLWVEVLTLEEVDALKKLFAPGRLALRYSGRRDELRLDTGFPGPYNGAKHMGCYPYWNGQDLWGTRNNAAINVLYFTGEGVSERRLHVPSLSITMSRK